MDNNNNTNVPKAIEEMSLPELREEVRKAEKVFNDKIK
jgi:hypothetical protein